MKIIVDAMGLVCAARSTRLREQKELAVVKIHNAKSCINEFWEPQLDEHRG